MARGVAGAKAWLAGKAVTAAASPGARTCASWHPGQEWIWEPGGLGVFDPGINALSILTEILPEPIHLTAADLDVPEGRDTPIAARLTFANGVAADFDWRQEGPQTWDIDLETDGGTLSLREGGGRLLTGGRRGRRPLALRRVPRPLRPHGRPGPGRQRDVDLAPLVHVADAFSLGRRARRGAVRF